MKVTLTINGLTTQAHFPRHNIDQLHLPLLQHFSALQRQLNRPLIIFLAAPPGTGKSTLTAFWEQLSRTDPNLLTLQTLPMDGFHHTNRWLEEHQLRHRKGAPETFDLEKLRTHIMALHEPDSRWPEYSRRLHDPVDAAISVTAPVLIVEGNWLLLDEPGWKDLAAMCDVSIFIRAEPAMLRERLINRKIQGGLEPQQADAFYDMTDGPNVIRVLQKSQGADIVLEMGSDNGYRRLDL